MQKTAIIMLAFTLFIACKNTNSEISSEENIKKFENRVEVKGDETKINKKVLSPHTSAMAMFGDTHIHIDYSSPGVRGREIFGKLVPYNIVWQAGAHNATWLETNMPLIINGEELIAGKYGFFVIPTKGDWTIIFNRNWNQHGKDQYDKNDDIIRFTISPKISDTISEHLEYKITKVNENEGTISLKWEKVALMIPFTLN